MIDEALSLDTLTDAPKCSRNLWGITEVTKKKFFRIGPRTIRGQIQEVSSLEVVKICPRNVKATKIIVERGSYLTVTPFNYIAPWLNSYVRLAVCFCQAKTNINHILSD